MKKLFYPAVFKTEDDGYSVIFPDVPECITQGDSMEEAYEMAFDALGLTLSYYYDNNIEIPKASSIDNIKLEKNQFIAIVEFDYNEYLKKNENITVRKYVNIPQWLNNEAVERKLNFSQILKDALLEQIK